jgi:hypothetical protein
MLMSSTSVYIIECAGYVKIGLAADPGSRLKEINIGAPIRAVLHRTREFESRTVAREIESRMHRLFARKRSNGEWFDITPGEAWEALKRQRPLRLVNPKARNDSVKRWESEEPHDITDILFGNITLEEVRARVASR